MEQSENFNKIRKHHLKTGCKCVSLREYKQGNNVLGYLCHTCKKEWLHDIINRNTLPDDVPLRPTEHHTVPTFCCLQVSDTGYFIQWRNISKGVLKPGDHVTWLRPLSYWHHAIVEKVEGESIHVIEWSASIHQKRRHKWNLLGNLCYSPMYKAYYPPDVEKQNPPEVVLMRANARLSDTGYGPLSDNCEHFATFCKTGSHSCNQLHQLKVTMRAWLRSVAISILHIALVICFSETLERYLGHHRDWLGAVLLVVSECVYLSIVFCTIYRVDTRREEFRSAESPSFTRACRCAMIKAALQSMTAIFFAAIFSVYLTIHRSRNDDDDWDVVKRMGLEIGFGVLGGIVGNILGFYLFQFVPYPCCRNELAEGNDDKQSSLNDICSFKVVESGIFEPSTII